MSYRLTQTKIGSLFEAHINALAGAPPAIIANYLLLDHFYPEAPTTEFILFWSIITWPVFFYLSVGRVWFVRRIFERWGIILEPSHLYIKLKERFRNKNT